MISYESDEEYQKKILEFFDLEEYNHEIIMTKTDKLYKKIKDISIFKEKMQEGASRIMSEDLEIGLVILFSYDNFIDFYTLLENHEIKLSD